MQASQGVHDGVFVFADCPADVAAITHLSPVGTLSFDKLVGGADEVVGLFDGRLCIFVTVKRTVLRKPIVEGFVDAHLERNVKVENVLEARTLAGAAGRGDEAAGFHILDFQQSSCEVARRVGTGHSHLEAAENHAVVALVRLPGGRKERGDDDFVAAEFVFQLGRGGCRRHELLEADDVDLKRQTLVGAGHKGCGLGFCEALGNDVF